MKTLLFLFLLLIFIPLPAQEDDYRQKLVNRRTLGFSIQQGIPFYRLPEGSSYKPTGLTANFHQPFFKSRRLVNVGIDIVPQLWISKAHEISMEAGLNANFNLNIQTGKASVLAFHIGSGFHYFGMHTQRQARGFIFADNFLVSYRHTLRIKNNKVYDLGCIAGFRHLSNLSLQEPNTGIDNIMIGLTFNRVF